jgi:hypothetical protein
VRIHLTTEGFYVERLGHGTNTQYIWWECLIKQKENASVFLFVIASPRSGEERLTGTPARRDLLFAFAPPQLCHLDRSVTALP